MMKQLGVTNMKNFKSMFLVFALTALVATSFQYVSAEKIGESTMSLDSPRKQMALGVDLHEIQCKTSYELVFKATDWSPACVMPSSVERLIQMGWAADHDTKHNKMMESMISQMDESTMTEMESMMKAKAIMSEAAKTSTSVSEGMEEMGDQSTKLKTGEGEFVGLAGHEGQGTAKIISAGEESFLRFEDFKVTNGPDLFVYITQDGDVHKGILLERLKGSTGSQNYELPADIDLEVYNTAVVYCKLFGVYFAEATLT